MRRPRVNLAVMTSTFEEDPQTKKVLKAIRKTNLNVNIALLIYDQYSPAAMEWAEENNLSMAFVNPVNKQPPLDRRILQEFEDHGGIDLVLLVGWKRYITSLLLDKYENRIINIHPSLLPAFDGKFSEKVHEAAIEAGVKISGCTLHFVTEELDGGPIILQTPVLVSLTDDPATCTTAESLKKEVQEAEIGTIVKGIRLYSEGRLKVVGNKVLTLSKNL